MPFHHRDGLLLGLTLLLLGVPLFGSKAAAADGQSTAAFALPLDTFSEKAAGILNHVLRENFAREPQFALNDVRGFLEGDIDSDPKIKALEAARKLVAKGKELYDNLELDEAIEELTRALGEFAKAIARLGDGQEYLDAALYLGAAYILSGDTERANEAFRKVAMYDRRKTLDPKVFPPSMIELFNKVKDEVGSAPVGTVLAKSTPAGAEVYLNGVFKGITPASLAKVPEGTHFVRMEKDGYAPWGQAVEFFATHEETLEATLKETGQRGRFASESQKAMGDLDDDPPATEAVGLGQWLGVNRLVLVSVKQRGDEVSAEASLIQIDPPKLLANRSASLNLLASNVLTQADAFFTSLYRKVDIPTAEVGGKGKEGAIAGTQVRCNSDSDCTSGEVCDETSGRCIPYAPEKDRFYQKWWFWAIVGGGLAVAGGTTFLVWYLLQPEQGAIEFTF